jgi:hypothetical protein
VQLSHTKFHPNRTLSRMTTVLNWRKTGFLHHQISSLPVQRSLQSALQLFSCRQRKRDKERL